MPNVVLTSLDNYHAAGETAQLPTVGVNFNMWGTYLNQTLQSIENFCTDFRTNALRTGAAIAGQLYFAAPGASAGIYLPGITTGSTPAFTPTREGAILADTSTGRVWFWTTVSGWVQIPVGAKVGLQTTGPGTAETGHFNITGTGRMGNLSVGNPSYTFGGGETIYARAPAPGFAAQFVSLMDSSNNLYFGIQTNATFGKSGIFISLPIRDARKNAASYQGGSIDLTGGNSDLTRLPHGYYSIVLGGYDGNTVGDYATSLGGQYNQAYAQHSVAQGKEAYSLINGSNAQSSGGFTTNGIGQAQTEDIVLRALTTDATATELTADFPTAGSAATRAGVGSQSCCVYSMQIVSMKLDGSAAASWKAEGMVRSPATAGTAVLVGNTVTAISNVPGWTLGVALVSDLNGNLQVTFTGAAATTIRTVATVRQTRVLGY